MLTYRWSLRDATLNQWSNDAVLNPNEFTVLDDCLVGRRGIFPRSRIARVGFQGTQVSMSSVRGLATYHASDGQKWLIVAYAERVGATIVGARLMAALISDSTPSVVFSRRVLSAEKADIAYLPFSFVSYRGLLYASNGYQVFTFNGQVWQGPNNLVARQGFAGGPGSRVAWGCANVFDSRLLLGNTPVYPNEILFPGLLEELPIETTWTGNAAGGGTGLATPLFATYFTDSATGYAVGALGKAVKTTDATTTWGDLTVGTNEDLRGVFMATDSLGWVVGANGALYKTINAGETWERQNIGGHSDADLHDVVAFSDRVALAGGASHMTGPIQLFFTTVNGGASWSVRYMAARVTGAVRGVCSEYGNRSGPTPGWRYFWGVGDDGHVWTIDYDGDATWYEATWKQVEADLQLNDIAMAFVTDVLYGAIAGNEGNIFYWDAVGESWETATVPGGISDILSIAYRDAATGLMVASGAAGVMLLSDDHGVNWTATVSGISSNIYDVHFPDAETGYAVSDAGITLKSVDGGLTWLQMGVGELDPNKLKGSVVLPQEEEARTIVRTEGQAYVFSNKGIRTYLFAGGSLAEQLFVDGFELLNQNCVVRYAGAFWMLGRQDDQPGLYIWSGGAEPPRLVSRRVQTVIDACYLEPTPATVNYKWDTKSDFTPVSGGIYFDTGYWTYKNGLLRLRKGTTEEKTVFSHGKPVVGGIEPDIDKGIYLPDVTDWGHIGIELALNEVAGFETRARLYVMTAPDNNGVPGTWGGFKNVYNPVLYDPPLPYTGQKQVPGRYFFRLRPEDFPPEHKWLQWKLVGANTKSRASNFLVNRINLRVLLRSGEHDYAPPSMLVFDDRLYCFLDDGTRGRVIIVGDEGKSFTTAVLGSTESQDAISASLAHGSRLVVGEQSTTNINRAPLLFSYADALPNAGESPPVSQTITSGWIDFADGDASVGSKWKKLKRVRLTVLSKYRPERKVTVRYWTDSGEIPVTLAEVTAYKTPFPKSGQPDRFIVELAGPYRTAANMGKRFKLEVTGMGVILEALEADAELVPDEKATAWQ